MNQTWPLSACVYCLVDEDREVNKTVQKSNTEFMMEPHIDSNGFCDGGRKR